MNGCYGRTFRELFPQTKEMTLDTFLDQWSKGMFLSLKTDGRTQESVSPKVGIGLSSGVCLTLNTSEKPLNGGGESSLYSILEHGGGYPPVLFESESLRRDSEESERKGEDPTSSLGENPSGNNCCTLDTSDQNLVKNQDDMAIVSKVFVKGTRPHSKDEAPTWKEGTVVNTLNTFNLGETRCNELVCESKKVLPKALDKTLMKMASVPNGGGYKVTGTLYATERKDTENQYVDQGKVVVEPYHKSDNTFIVSQETFLNVDEGVSPPLKARDYKAPHAVCYKEPVVAIEGNGSRPSHKGDGINTSGVQYTLNTTEVHAVGYMEKEANLESKDLFVISQESTPKVGTKVSTTLTATDCKRPHIVSYEASKIYDMKQHHAPIEMDVVSWKERDRLAPIMNNMIGTLAASDYKGTSFVGYMEYPKDENDS